MVKRTFEPKVENYSSHNCVICKKEIADSPLAYCSLECWYSKNEDCKKNLIKNEHCHIRDCKNKVTSITLGKSYCSWHRYCWKNS